MIPSYKQSSGQSVAEVLVVLAVLVPLLLTVASFSNLLTLNTETVEAARFAAWERTVYNDGDPSVEDRIAKNIDDIYLARRYSDFAPGSDKSSGIPSIVDKSLPYSQRVSLNVPEGEISGTEIASKDTALANRVFGALSSGGGNMAMRSPEVSIALNSDYSLLKTISFQNYNKVEYSDPSLPYDEVAGRSQFNVASSAALIANGWMPEDDEDLRDVTHQAAFDGGALRSFESANPAFRFFGFQEAGLPAQGSGSEGGYSTVASDSDAYVPPDP